MKLTIDLETWPFRRPFRISNETFMQCTVVVATVHEQGLIGRGEACGVGYRGDSPDQIVAQLRAIAPALSGPVNHPRILDLLPEGGARNALDCALWDWRAKVAGCPVWSLAGIAQPRPLLTTFTVGADGPAAMAARAIDHDGARAIKLKLIGDDDDADRVAAVRAALPTVWLGVDGNQGFTRDRLDALLPALVEADVRLIEQPFPIGCDAWLDGMARAIPVFADESAQTGADLPMLVGRYDGVNIKLDKCGGLTHGLEMAAQARALGLQVMVGNMTGTSWSQAPAFLLGQSCDIVDLDGPLFLAGDRVPAVTYRNGLVECSDRVWGGGHAG